MSNDTKPEDLVLGLNNLKRAFLKTYYKVDSVLTINQQWKTYLGLARRQGVGKISHELWFYSSHWRFFESISSTIVDDINKIEALCE